MKLVVSLAILSSLLAACATGTLTPESSTTKKDGGILSKGDSGSNPPPGDDGGITPPPSGCTTGTACGADCVDVTSDPNNCGGCGIACNLGETCVSGQCMGSAPTTNEPPQGSCSHSLCTSGGPLTEGCDTDGCSIIICDPSYVGDTVCCDTGWDSVCVGEVTTYCSPYSCN